MTIAPFGLLRHSCPQGAMKDEPGTEKQRAGNLCLVHRFREVGRLRRLRRVVYGLRRKGEGAGDTPGGAMAAVRRLRQAKRNEPMSDMRRDGMATRRRPGLTVIVTS